MSEKRERFRFTDIILAVSFVLISIAVFRGCHQDRSRPSGSVLPAQLPQEASEPVHPTVYRLDKIKSAGTSSAPGEVNDLKAAYEQYPKSDAGGNIIEGWSKVKPEDKVKIREALDRDIETSEEALRMNPDDKKAKSLLSISRMLKELASRDFNITPGEQSAVLQTEDSSKIKR